MEFLDQLIGTFSDSGLLQSDMAKWTLAFIIAGRLHRRWVRKDMSEQFGKVTEAIDRVAVVLGARLDSIERRVERLEDESA